MNWNNYGSYWHADYVKPCALFYIENENDRRIMNHWSNLSPLEKHENIIFMRTTVTSSDRKSRYQSHLNFSRNR